MLRMKILQPSELMERVCVVLGTRPGNIKMPPIVRFLQMHSVPFFILHTSQHYSYNMDRIFFEDLGLPASSHYVERVSECIFHGEQTARMLSGVEKVLLQNKPRIVLVGGDANTNLAGALAARKLHIEVGQVEAGLRSNDRRMPEEHNRAMIDHISEYLFASARCYESYA